MSSDKLAVLRIDGRTLEGGGQLLRLAVGLAALTGQAIHIDHIRGLRSGGGGFKAQHLACVRWLAAACGAYTEGAETRSHDLMFRPRSSPSPRIPGNYTKTTLEDGRSTFETRVDVGSPGSVGLVLQAILPFIIFRPPVLDPTEEQQPTIKITITGGTNVSNSPSYDYIKQVLLPTLHSLGLPAIEAQIDRRGWSIGGSSIGSVSFVIPTLRPEALFSSERFQPFDGIDEDKRHPSFIEATVIAPRALHEIFTKSLTNTIGRLFKPHVKLNISREDSQHEKRVYLLATAKVKSKDRELIFGSDELLQGHKRETPEALVEGITDRVLNQLIEDIESGACVDRHMIDQLVVFQALASGESVVGRGTSGKQSLHAETAEWVARTLIGAEADVGKVKGVGLMACNAVARNDGMEGAEHVVMKMDDLELK